MVAAQHKEDIELTKDTPYLALTSELWGVCCEDFGENWQRYYGTVLYVGHLYKAYTFIYLNVLMIHV